MFRTLRKAEYAELMILFFIQSAAMAIWFVPLGPILDAHGLHGIKSFAFAASAVAMFPAITWIFQFFLISRTVSTTLRLISWVAAALTIVTATAGTAAAAATT